MVHKPSYWLKPDWCTVHCLCDLRQVHTLRCPFNCGLTSWSAPLRTRPTGYFIIPLRFFVLLLFYRHRLRLTTTYAVIVPLSVWWSHCYSSRLIHFYLEKISFSSTCCFSPTILCVSVYVRPSTHWENLSSRLLWANYVCKSTRKHVLFAQLGYLFGDWDSNDAISHITSSLLSHFLPPPTSFCSLLEFPSVLVFVTPPVSLGVLVALELRIHSFNTLNSWILFRPRPFIILAQAVLPSRFSALSHVCSFCVRLSRDLVRGPAILDRSTLWLQPRSLQVWIYVPSVQPPWRLLCSSSEITSITRLTRHFVYVQSWRK